MSTNIRCRRARAIACAARTRSARTRNGRQKTPRRRRTASARCTLSAPRRNLPLFGQARCMIANAKTTKFAAALSLLPCQPACIMTASAKTTSSALTANGSSAQVQHIKTASAVVSAHAVLDTMRPLRRRARRIASALRVQLGRSSTALATTSLANGAAWVRTRTFRAKCGASIARRAPIRTSWGKKAACFASPANTRRSRVGVSATNALPVNSTPTCCAPRHARSATTTALQVATTAAAVPRRLVSAWRALQVSTSQTQAPMAAPCVRQAAMRLSKR